MLLGPNADTLRLKIAFELENLRLEAVPKMLVCPSCVLLSVLNRKGDFE
jgi:hypothetical protein